MAEEAKHSEQLPDQAATTVPEQPAPEQAAPEPAEASEPAEAPEPAAPESAGQPESATEAPEPAAAPKHAAAPKKNTTAIALIVVVFLLLCAGVAGASQLQAPEFGQLAQRLLPDGQQAAESSASEDAKGDQDASDKQGAKEPEAEDAPDVSKVHLPTRQIAEYDGIPIHSPIAQEELTGVLFHQASYETAVVMTTELPEADPEAVSVDNPVRVNNKQKKGDWVDADALHLYRMTDTTQMDTSVDVGAPWGSTVFAPVTGTVVLVKNYDLYGEVPDVRIHIQPDGHPELDVVLLHQYDPMVKAGDRVEAGMTPLAYVRDIAADLTDIQLGFFTEPDDPGNHSHVQVNNADSPGYREDSLKGAIKVDANGTIIPSSSSSAKKSSSSESAESARSSGSAESAGSSSHSG